MSIPGQITRRLLAQFPPADPAWTPPRSSATKPLRSAGDGWSAGGRTAADGTPVPPADGAAAPGLSCQAAPARVALPTGRSVTRVTPRRREEIAVGLAQSAILAGLLVAGAGVPVL